MVNEILFVAIVNRGMADEVLSEMQGFGLTGGIVFHGEGTVQNRLLQILGLNESQKDVIVVPIPRLFENPLHEMMLQTFNVNKKHRGICFSIPMSHNMTFDILEEGYRFDPALFEYHCIHVILENDRSYDLIEVARGAGATGGTIIHGHGVGVPSEDSYFNIQIEPEKDMVLILAKHAMVPQIREAIVDKMELEKPGNGILFVMPCTRVTGLYEGSNIRGVGA